jgi:hypothetical protein
MTTATRHPLPPRKKAWIQLIVLFLAGISVADEPTTPGRLEVGSREFKLRLDPASVDDDAERKVLFRAMAGFGAEAPVPGSFIDAKRCRRVRYLDTEKAELRALGYVLRAREKLSDKKCQSRVAESSELALKRRGAAEELEESLGRAWAKGAKIEEDALVGASAEVLVVSLSAKAKGTAAPASVSATRAVFKEALPQLDGESALAYGCREVYERRWELRLPGVPAGGKAPELTLWLAPDGEPWLAELSYKQRSLESKRVGRWAASLLSHLRTALTEQLVPAGSKTEAIYGCVASSSGGER